MKKAENFLLQKLSERVKNGNYRDLPSTSLPFDLSFARAKILTGQILIEHDKLEATKNGASGSRLITGNHPYTITTEQQIAEFHDAEAGLIFNSGYDANVGLLSSILQRGDTIICDELIHASIVDGARLSYANRYKFKHNDLEDLENKLKLAIGNSYVVVESVYSMDGDCAPLTEMIKLCEKYEANLIVDEAHAVGVFGSNGRGLVHQLGLQEKVFARIITFGKALGSHGAIVLGSLNLRNFLINFARSFIYTTAAPIHQIVAINCAYTHLKNTNYQIDLSHKIEEYNLLIKDLNFPSIKSSSAIQTILFDNNQETKAAAQHLQAQGFDVRAILSPTVAKGKERLRICLHLHNTEQEIIDLVNALKSKTS
jgi:8-amino-7-oxononanoate synthase